WLAISLGYIVAEGGWIVAEVGRQPWAIQDLLPVHIAATQPGKVNVQISFWIFAVRFTALSIAEVKIMLTQIDKGFDAHAVHIP
ncbi:cytochrome ubiquinol oxidase subunit I, partial [Campylobacter jejuni]|uniref:cytochrome ubiquinol oxidase subunit I n=1 Tax=Campylobacter jejuni TaxID=197 RepID=UPI000D56FD44